MLCPDFSGGSAKRFCARGLSLFDPLSLVLCHPGYDEPAIYCLSLEHLRSSFGHVLFQRRLDDGRAFKTQALAIAHHAIHQRAVEQLSGTADLVPAQCVLPTTVMQIA